MDGLTLDQIAVFLSVSETGSFSAAARQLGRAQSAVTYAIAKLEDQSGVLLFDRADYRPQLTPAGRALLPRARRVAENANLFRAQARGIAGGLEPELSLVADSMFPMGDLIEALRAFGTSFPTVTTRLYVESLGAANRLVAEGVCTLGLIVPYPGAVAGMTRIPLTEIELVMLAAPDHPLAALEGPIAPAVLRDHVQLVLTDRSQALGDRDFGVHATQTWRLGDLGAKHAMLRAGLGYGSLPLHMAAADLAAGRLKRIVPAEWDGAARPVPLPFAIAHRADARLGPASLWLIARLTGAPAA